MNINNEAIVATDTTINLHEKKEEAAVSFESLISNGYIIIMHIK